MGKNSEKKNLDQFLTLDLDQFLTLETPNLGPFFSSTAHIYIYAVKLKTGRMFALFCVKNWSFFVFENLVLPAEKKIFKKQT